MNGEAERVLAQAFLRDHPEEAALVLERLAPQDSALHLCEIEASSAARVVSRLVPSMAAEAVERMPGLNAAEIVSALEEDAASVLVRTMDRQKREELLALLPAETADLLRRLIAHSPDTAGALMDPRPMVVPEDIGVAEAAVRVRRTPALVPDYLYVVDRERRLVGIVHLYRLSAHAPRQSLKAVMQPADSWIRADAGPAEIVQHPGWRHQHALPVVDERMELLGTLRYGAMRRLEERISGAAQGREWPSTAHALVRLYVLGMIHLFESAAAAVSGSSAAPGAGERRT